MYQFEVQMILILLLLIFYFEGVTHFRRRGSEMCDSL